MSSCLLGKNGGSMDGMTSVQQLHAQILQHLQTLKRELDRLTVRESALERCRQAIVVQKHSDGTDEENEAFDEIIASVDDIEYDLATFKDQLRERMTHVERGLRLVSVHSDDKNAGMLHQYILEGAALCTRDAAAARAGYDELIANVKEMTQLRDS